MTKSLPDSKNLEQALLAEILSRRRARSNILEYARSIVIPGKPVGDEEETEVFRPVEASFADHHRLILQAIDETSRTPYGRLMIFAPPGSAKSSYASVVFPSAFLGREPDRRIILASYGDDLARKMGRRTRSIIRQPKYKGIYGTELVSDSQAAHEFGLTNGSEYMACGILSGVTGNRCHGLIIDDPVKGREQANSEAIRNKTWDAYKDDLKTRLVPGGWEVLIQTRWHQDDVAGRILPDDWRGESGRILCKDGMYWTVLCLQARCETDSDPLGRKRGEYLWPEWFDEKHWRQFENSPVTWPSLYQQIPSPASGGIFKPGNLQVVEAIPALPIQWVRGWDFGATSSGDWTAGAKLGKLPDGRFIIADMARMRVGPDERDTALLNISRADGRGVKVDLPQDPGQAGKSQIVYLTRLLSGFNVSSSPESGDKVIRAEPFAAQVNAGNVLMLKAPWNDALRAELSLFPNGTNDDQVDALSRAFMSFVDNKYGLLDYVAGLVKKHDADSHQSGPWTFDALNQRL